MSYFQYVKNILEISLIIISLAGIVLLGSQYILQSYLDELTNTITATQNRHTSTNIEIKNINSTLLKVDKIQKEYKTITPLMPEIVTAIPNNIILSALDINLQKKIINLSGNSPTRDDLLELQANLENIEWLENAYIPLSQLTEKESINFSFTVELKK